MKNIFLLAAVVMFSHGVLRAQTKPFSWLVGTWKMSEKNVYEQWHLNADGVTLNGSSYKLKGSDTTLLEQTKIIINGNSIMYVADVAGDQHPVEFRVVSSDEVGFVAENPKHDFPKIIRYKHVMRDTREFIYASIEGDGKILPYIFERIR